MQNAMENALVIAEQTPLMDVRTSTPDAPKQLNRRRRRIGEIVDSRMKKLRRRIDFDEAATSNSTQTTELQQSSETAPAEQQQQQPTQFGNNQQTSTQFGNDQQQQIPYTRKLGRNRFFSIKEWCGETKFHIRVYEELPEKNGNIALIPSKKGVVLTKLQMVSMLATIEMIGKALELKHTDNNRTVFECHLGGGRYLNVKSYNRNFYVDIRKYFKPDDVDSPIPTREGINLNISEWHVFEGLVETIKRIVPELQTLTPCFASEDHQNQLGYLQCFECNPFDCQNW
jgi:hypothetical protein